MSTVATRMVPELALSVATLTTISPHLAGAYAVSLTDADVTIQGAAADVAHTAAALDLSLEKEYERGGYHYAIWEGPAPAQFAAITVRVVAVSK